MKREREIHISFKLSMVCTRACTFPTPTRDFIFVRIIPPFQNVMFEHENGMRTGGNISSIFSWKMSNAGGRLAASAARRSSEILVVVKNAAAVDMHFLARVERQGKTGHLLTRAWSLGKIAKVSNYPSRDTTPCDQSCDKFLNPLHTHCAEYLRLFGSRRTGG